MKCFDRFMVQIFGVPQVTVANTSYLSNAMTTQKGVGRPLVSRGDDTWIPSKLLAVVGRFSARCGQKNLVYHVANSAYQGTYIRVAVQLWVHS